MAWSPWPKSSFFTKERLSNCTLHIVHCGKYRLQCAMCDVQFTTMDAPIIAIDHVSKIYNSNGSTVTALHDVSLSIAPGEFISLIGPSGCGKSTLMRLIGDLDQPSSGSIQLKGKAPERARIDRDYGIVFQAPVL